VIAIVDDKGDELTSLPEINGVVTGGPAEFRFSGRLPRSPVRVESTFHVESERPGMSKFVANTSFESGEWRGQPIPQLAYFEQIRAFFTPRPNGRQLRFKCYCLGNLYQTHNVPMEAAHFWHGVRDVVDTLQRAREICTHFGVAPPFPDGLHAGDLDTIDEIYWLLGKGDAPARTRGLTITTHMEREAVAKLLEETAQFDQLERAKLALNFDGRKVTLFGANMDLGEIKVGMDAVAITSTASELRRALDDGAESVPVKWRSTAESIYTVAPLPPGSTD
jgi:hypothetical protein